MDPANNKLFYFDEDMNYEGLFGEDERNNEPLVTLNKEDEGIVLISQHENMIETYNALLLHLKNNAQLET